MNDVKQYKKLPRLYVAEQGLTAEAEIFLPEDQVHYVRNVMRLNTGDQVRVFNGRDGEWIAIAKEINKKKALFKAVKAVHYQYNVPKMTVLVSPVKKDAFDWMVQKASELGVSEFQPVICDHSFIRKTKDTRLETIAQEAAEQCERLDIMAIKPMESLKNMLDTWDGSQKILLCLEREKATPIVEALQKEDFNGALPAVLIGPEGGFSENEITWLQSLDFVIPISLGNRILKAETALISAVTCVQALCGDWA